VALTTSFGPARLERFIVKMEEVADDLVTPLHPQSPPMTLPGSLAAVA
jgi:hypothetical protein